MVGFMFQWELDCSFGYEIYLWLVLATNCYLLFFIFNNGIFLLFYWKVSLLNLITISSTWARVIDVMDNEVLMLSPLLYEDYDFLCALKFCFGFSQVQDCLVSLVLVQRLASFLGLCLPREWPGWGHVCIPIWLSACRVVNIWSFSSFSFLFLCSVYSQFYSYLLPFWWN